MLRLSRASAQAAAVCLAVTLAQPTSVHGGPAPILVELRLRTGGQIGGQLLDHADHGLVLLHGETPYVFAWCELDGGSAYIVRRHILLQEQGRLAASDHFKLGLFALANGRPDLASNSFKAAAQIDRTYKRRAENAFAESRQRERSHEPDQTAGFATEPLPEMATPETEFSEAPVAGSSDGDQPLTIPAGLLASGPALRDQVRAAYLKFGDKVREVLGRDIVLVETDHFLIWTDWRYRERPLLADMLEEMYLSLCEQFDLNPAEDIFLAKCPVFCFQRPGRFRKFAQKFDGYSGKDSIGYTRSVEANGHVHLVLVRQGDTRIDADRFATTLVHEGTHAFVHRLYSPRLIPHWVNEGLADFMAERVLGDRSPTAENADMLARQYVKHGWPIGNLLRGSGPIGIHEYPVAHSLVALLADPVFSGQAGEPDLPLAGVSVSGSSTAFTAFIRSLKDGLDCPAALAANYGGLTPEQLESRWHERYQPAE